MSSPPMKLSLSVVTATILLTHHPPTAQTVDQLTAHRVRLESVEYRGKRAVKVSEDGVVPNAQAYAIVNGSWSKGRPRACTCRGRPSHVSSQTISISTTL